MGGGRITRSIVIVTLGLGLIALAVAASCAPSPGTTVEPSPGPTDEATDTGFIAVAAIDDSPDDDARLDLTVADADGEVAAERTIVSGQAVWRIEDVEPGAYRLDLDKTSLGEPWTILELDCQETVGPDISADLETSVESPQSARIGVDANETVSCTYALTDWTVPVAGAWTATNTRTRLVGGPACEEAGELVLDGEEDGRVQVQPAMPLAGKSIMLGDETYESVEKDRYAPEGGGSTCTLTVQSPREMTLVETSTEGAAGVAPQAPPGCEVERTYVLTPDDGDGKQE